MGKPIRPLRRAQGKQAQGKQFKLGDAIAWLAKLLHIPHCDNCERRRIILNEIQSVGMKETMKRLKDCCE